MRKTTCRKGLTSTSRNSKRKRKEVVSPELEQEWIKFCKDEFEEWKKTNPPSPLFINNPRWMVDWEVERKEKWVKHINKLGDEWWKVRGYKTIWPDDDNKPLQVMKEITNEK